MAARGRQLIGTTLFGILGFALAYTFLYEALRDAPAGVSMLTLAIVPLLTVLLGAGQRIERLHWFGLAGAVVAAVGIGIIAADQLRLDVPPLSIALLLLAASCQAESGLIVKRFPPGDPVAANGLGMLLGGALLAVAALVTRESFVVPTRPETWLATAYLIGPGSIGVFVLVLYVLARWTATATSYSFLLFPLVAVVFGAVLLREPIQPSFVIGGLIVAAGVYLGAIRRDRPTTRRPRPEPEPTTG